MNADASELPPQPNPVGERAYRDVLLRAPDPEGHSGYGRAIAAGRLDAAALARTLAVSREHRTVVEPLRQLVGRAYALLFDRAPSAEELARHMQQFRHETGGDDGVRARLADRTAVRHLGIRPLNVEMDVTNQCNIRCVMCYFSDPIVGRRKREDLTEAQFRRIADQLFPWVNRLSLTLGAEPLIHPQIAAFVRIAKAYRVPKAYVNTNAVRLDRELAVRLLDAGIDAINVSLDAGTAATFERVRRGAKFDSVLGNLRALEEEKRRRGTTRPRLSLSFVLMRSTVHEVPEFLRLAHSLGVGDVHLIHMVPYESLDIRHELLADDQARCNVVLEQARALARELGLVLRAPADFPAGAPEPEGAALPAVAFTASPYSKRPAARLRFDLNLDAEDEARGCCPFPWHFLGILPGGQVSPCGWWYDGPHLGNILQQTFAEIWQGEPMRRLRSDLQQHVLGPNCSRCPAAGMGLATEPAAFAVRQPVREATGQPVDHGGRP